MSMYYFTAKKRAKIVRPFAAFFTAVFMLTMTLQSLPFGTGVQNAFATTTSTTFDSSGTWTAPAGVTQVTVEAWGGGAGGGQNTGNGGRRGGGGGGAYAESTVTVVPGTTYNIVVGLGGDPGNGSALDGGDSYFDTGLQVLAKGGGASIGGNNGGAGGSDGASIGTIKKPGGNGGDRASGGGASSGGGGGGSATATTNGNDGANGSGNNGGAGGTGQGNGGNGGNNNNSGQNGSVPGGGGGGRGDGNGLTSGSGAHGRVVLTWQIPTHTLTVTKTGTGTGTVTADSGAINCGATCSDTYDDGTTVVLTAAAAGDSTFTGWSGTAGCSGTSTCPITISSNVTATANFDTSVSPSPSVSPSESPSPSPSESSSPSPSVSPSPSPSDSPSPSPSESPSPSPSESPSPSPSESPSPSPSVSPSPSPSESPSPTPSDAPTPTPTPGGGGGGGGSGGGGTIILNLSLSTDPSTVNAGGQAKGTVTVNNVGNLFDNNVVITVTLPEGFSFVEGGTAKNFFVLPFVNTALADSSGSMTFPTISSFAPGASQSFTFNMNVSGSTAPGTYPINASVGSTFYTTALLAQANINVVAGGTGGGGGGTTPTPAPTPTPQVAGASTGPSTQGEVLGASTQTLPATGFDFTDRMLLSLFIALASTGILLIMLGARILPMKLERIFLAEPLN